MRLLLILVIVSILAEAKKRRLQKKKLDEEISTSDVERKYVKVPFGHIFKEGFKPDSKQPIDLLELDIKSSKVLDLYKGNVKSQAPKGFASPKDSFYFGELLPEEIKLIKEKSERKRKRIKTPSEIDDKDLNEDVEEKNVNKDTKPWFDLVANNARNLAMTRYRNPGPIHPFRQNVNSSVLIDSNYETKERFFSRKSFGLEQSIKKQDSKTENWTTCDEFGRNADFHPKDVVNINWIPFYSWSSKDLYRPVAFVHKFSYPTVKMVQKYKEELGPHLNNTVNWDEPKLFLDADLDMLMVAVDRRGHFTGIPYNEVPSSMKNSKLIVPTVNLRLKIVDAYLAMMFCDIQYATIMAVSGHEPTTINELRSQAATLKFRGIGYPVTRNLEEEIAIAKLERESKIGREKDMFLEPEDLVEEPFPFELN